jgi:hypothetical protein
LISNEEQNILREKEVGRGRILKIEEERRAFENNQTI